MQPTLLVFAESDTTARRTSVLPTMSLRAKIVCIFTAMTMVVLAGGGGLFWYTYRLDTALDEMVGTEFLLYRTAQDMELALANQKGFLTYYLVDGDGKWLQALGQYRQLFSQSLEQAASLDLPDKQRQTLDRIARRYQEYVEAKDIAIETYRQNATLGGISVSSLHEKQRENYFGLLELCRNFSQEQWRLIHESEESTIVRSGKLRKIQVGVIVLFMTLGGFFLFILYKYILGPIRGLAIETGSTPQASLMDEVDSLKHSLQGMMSDLGETSDELAKSRRHLLQAERMAMVGELAAGVAHTIRNPFTSIKMRMFSLARSLELTDIQNDDLKVISDEIARIDKIVQNFLEFARPPKLRLEECSLGDVINSVLTLLEYRLKAYNVQVQYKASADLCRVWLDADRIKEALVNLVINACEAMESGGRIDIVESRGHDPALGDIAVIVVRDSGPGIPAALIDKVATPFFTTKEDGSGLGLSIVSRIIREHNGKFIISPNVEEGAEFNIWLPVKGKQP